MNKLGLARVHSLFFYFGSMSNIIMITVSTPIVGLIPSLATV